MGEKLTTYDPAEDLGSDEAIAVFMEEAFKTEDAGYIAHALGVVARAFATSANANVRLLRLRDVRACWRRCSRVRWRGRRGEGGGRG